MAQVPSATSGENETRHLAEFCSNLHIDDLSSATIETTEKAVVDTLAASYAGIPTEPGRIILQFVDEKPAGSASVIGTEQLSTPEYAALANGTTAHALDVDDGHRGASGHPGSAVIPAALAIAESNDRTGAELITAIVAGYEAFGTVGEAVQPSHRNRGFHATATVGCFGAAAAVASLKELDSQTTAYALGLAGTQAGGLFEFLAKGSMAKRFHPGRAGMAGILAVELAERGFDGPDTIIEGTDGFARAFSDNYDNSTFDSMGDPFAIEEGYLKPYPCCRHIHGPIEAGISIHDSGLDPFDVTSVRIETFATAAKHDKTVIENVLDAQMSMPFGVAISLYYGEATLEHFDPTHASIPEIRHLMDRVTIEATTEMEEKYPACRPCHVTVETETDVYEVSIDYPLGAAENPFSQEQVETKFHDLAQSALTESHSTEILETAFDLVAVQSISEFAELL